MGHPWVLWGHLKVNQGSLWGFINTQRTGLTAFNHWVDPTEDTAMAMGQMWGTHGCYGAPMGAMGTPESQPGVTIGFH